VEGGLRVVRKHDESQQEIVPDPDELEHEHRNQTRREDRQGHLPEDPKLVCAVDPRRLDHLVGNRRLGVYPPEVDAEGADEYRQKHRPVAVCHSDPGHEQVLGYRQGDLREHDTGENRAEDEIATTETVLGQAIPGRRRHNGRHQCASTRIDQAVESPVPEHAADVAREAAQVIEEARAGDEREGAGQLCRFLDEAVNTQATGMRQ
jgi:hypothetical protein